MALRKLQLASLSARTKVGALLLLLFGAAVAVVLAIATGVLPGLPPLSHAFTNSDPPELFQGQEVGPVDRIESNAAQPSDKSIIVRWTSGESATDVELSIELRAGVSKTRVPIGRTSEGGCARMPASTIRSGSADALLACTGLIRHRFPLTSHDMATDGDLVFTMPPSVQLQLFDDNLLFDHATVVANPHDLSKSSAVTLQRSDTVAAAQGAALEFMTFSADGSQLSCGRHTIAVGSDRRHYLVRGEAPGALVATCIVTTGGAPLLGAEVAWVVFGASLIAQKSSEEVLVTKTNAAGRACLHLPGVFAFVRMKVSHHGFETVEGALVATHGAENAYKVELRKGAALNVHCAGLPLGEGLSIVNSVPSSAMSSRSYYVAQELDAEIVAFNSVPSDVETDVKVFDADWNVLGECRVPPISQGATTDVALVPLRPLARLVVDAMDPGAIRRISIDVVGSQLAVSCSPPVHWPVVRYLPVGTVRVTAEDDIAAVLSQTSLELRPEGCHLEISPGATRRLRLRDQEGEAIAHYPITVSDGRTTRRLYSDVYGDLVLAAGTAPIITDGISGEKIVLETADADDRIRIAMLNTVMRNTEPSAVSVQVIALGSGKRLTKEVWRQEFCLNEAGVGVRLPYGRFQVRSTDGSVLYHAGFVQFPGQAIEVAVGGLVRVCLRGCVKRGDTAELSRRSDGARFLFPVSHDGAFVVPDPMVHGHYTIAITRNGSVVSGAVAELVGHEQIVDIL